MAEVLHCSDFLKHLDSQFQLARADQSPLPLTLIEVNERNDSPRLEQFSILFRGPLTPCMPQHIYALEHETMGSVSLFLVPIGPDEIGMRYEAVVSRFLR